MQTESHPLPASERRALRHGLLILGGFALIAALVAWGILAFTAMPSTAPWPEPATSAVVPPGPPPSAEPLVFAELPPETARAINQKIAFAPLGKLALPFTPTGDLASRGRAIDCLAAAMWYEAGDDAAGDASVGQVVLNRVRHPAFPGTICGVVFQGAERSSGCQFTFTCDGALSRLPSRQTFDRIRTRAAVLFGGKVDSAVGLATHYHADWVHPIWSAQLEKIARVGTHLFFRWKGAWGGPGAQIKHYAGDEPFIVQLAALSPAHQPPLDPLASESAMVSGAGSTRIDDARGTIRVAFSPLRNGNVQALAAFELCGDRDFCEITGVLEGGGQAAPVVFRYLRDRLRKVERVQWDCSRFKRPTSVQCMGAVNAAKAP